MPWKNRLKTCLITCLLTFGFAASAYAAEVVQWKFEIKKLANQQYKLICTAAIKSGWHVYSQNPGEGPVPTRITLQKNPLIKLKSKQAKELGKLIKHFDSGFGKELQYYEQQLVLEQLLELRGKVKTRLQGVLEYMACDASRCLPPKKVNFELDL